MSERAWSMRHALWGMLAACSPAGEGPDGATASASTGADASTGEAPGSTSGPTTGAAAVCPADPRLALEADAVDAGFALELPPGLTCPATITLPEPRVLAVTAAGASLSIEAGAEDEPGWLAPRVWPAGETVIAVTNAGDATLTVTAAVHVFGPPRTELAHEQSLAWTQAEILDDPAMCRLACVMSTIAADGHGGRLLQQWMGRFATTAHSERLGPKQLLDEFAAQQGTPPDLWDLEALPFTVTGVHNRIDLRAADHCGELRISFASTHPIFRPFHLIFLFRQVARAEDLSPGGVAHCAATAQRWAALSLLDGAALAQAVHAELSAAIAGENFLVAETVEFTISPWEWRQWFFDDNPDPLLPRIFDNRPLFQTVDIARMNEPGSERDAFLAWVSENAAAIDARQLEIPEPFRSQSTRANQGVPWVPLELTGVDPAVLAAYPDLRRNLEIVGCPACHTADAAFVQTLPNRTFSPFYEKELDARALHLAALANGAAAAAPFGPLQPGPVLPP